MIGCGYAVTVAVLRGWSWYIYNTMIERRVFSYREIQSRILANKRQNRETLRKLS